MIDFLVVLGFTQLVSIGCLLIYVVIFLIYDLGGKCFKKKTNIEKLIEEEISKES